MVGRKTYDKNPSIHIQNLNLTCESTVKLLGIDIDYQLNFDAHISTKGIVICIIIQGAIRNKVKYVINKDIK
jgi:hypothetical protein